MEGSEKDLTIHLYRKEEVIACLMYAAVNRNTRETLFWGLELYDSDYEMDAIATLAYIWFHQLGIPCWPAWQALCDIVKSGELDREIWQRLLYAWCRTPTRDCTTLLLLIRGGMTPANWTPAFTHARTFTTTRDAVKDCLFRGKTLDAWLLARAMRPEDQWGLLEEVTLGRGRQGQLSDLRYATDFGEDIVKRAMGFSMASMDTVRWDAIISKQVDLTAELPKEFSDLVAEWDAEDNLRKRRVFPIRSEACLYLTARSSTPTSESLESDLMTGLEASLWASKYWRAVLERHGVRGISGDGRIGITDKCREAFYDTYFHFASHDIPDEWSRADREKSHGRGCGKTAENARQLYLTRIFQRSQSAGIWRGCQEMKGVTVSDLDFEVVYAEAREACQTHLEAMMPLKPMTLQLDAN